MIGLGRLLRRFGAGALIAAVFGNAAVAQAQDAVITGRVSDEAGGPITGANVSIGTMGMNVTTNTNGVYRLLVPAARVSGQSVILAARHLGFGPQSRQVAVTAGSQTVDFTLKSEAVKLEALVVTGVAEATSTKKLTIGVAHVGEAEISQVPSVSPIGALQGKVAGARIALSRGQPGANPVVRLRGSTNLTIGGSSPLLIVDGVITRGSLADLDANDIESIEVLKGAASANTFGSDAANGVINIITKRGKNASDTRFSLTARGEAGTGNQEKFTPINTHHHYKLNPDGSFVLSGGVRVADTDHIADNNYPGAIVNQQKEWTRNGNFGNSYVNLGLRRQALNLSTSYSTERNAGILPFLNGEKKDNIRVNFDQGLLDNLDMSASLLYAQSNNDQDPNPATNGGGTATFFALLQAPPDVNLEYPNGTGDLRFNRHLPTAVSPSARDNPLYDLFSRDQSFRRERMFGSFTGRYRPTTWLTFDGTYGTDRLNTNNTSYAFKGYLTDQGVPGNGDYSEGFFRSTNQNTQVNGTASNHFGSLKSTTRLTYLIEDTYQAQQSGATTKLNVDLPTLNGGDPTQNSFASSQQTIRAQDYYVTQQLDLKDRYLAQLVYRRDGSSLFGSNDRYRDYYGISGAYRITQDFNIPGVQELKIRAARGTAGLRPGFTSQYERYALSNGSLSKSALGNKDLKPAEQTENEYSINSDFLDRFSLELTRADRVTKGAFLNVPLSSAKSGGFVSQVQNAADVSARTFEAQLNTRVLESSRYSWNMTLVGDRTRQFIDKLGVAPFNNTDAFGQNQGQQFYYKQGERLGVMYGSRWVKNLSELADNPVNKANATFTTDNYVVNELGYVVTKASYHTINERPIKYVDGTGNTLVKIGDVNPSFNYGVTNDVRFGDFGLHMLVDGVKGGQIYNFTKQWMFQDYRHADEDQSGVPVEARKPVEFYSASFYDGLAPNSYFVENGSYAKLRELSVNYTLPNSVRSAIGLSRFTNGVKIALIGRNLKTWSKYSGADPETLAGDDFNFRLDGFRYPSLRQVTGQITFNY
ncbi:MAG: hypothetical protein JWO05_3615 [Gemmatimonadetes bacterium]|nr:hypothetical protein [Gemmatimonadota bacterium]